MRPRPCWISQTNHPMLLRLSNPAWEVSMPSSNTMKCVSVQSRTVLLTYLPQECKDIEENLEDLVLWLTKLKDIMATTNTDENPQEPERRKQLTRFLSPPYRLIDSRRLPALDPWTASRNDLGGCWKKGRVPRSSIKGGIPE